MSEQNSINSNNFMLGVNHSKNRNVKPSNSLLNHLKELEKSNIAKINGNSNKILKVNNKPPESTEKLFTGLINKLETDVYTLNDKIKNFNKEKKNIIDLNNKEIERLKEIIRTMYALVLTIDKSIDLGKYNRVNLLEKLRKTIGDNKGLLKNIDEIMSKTNHINTDHFENNENRIKISNIMKNINVKINKVNNSSPVIEIIPKNTNVKLNNSAIEELPMNRIEELPINSNKSINGLNNYYNNLKNKNNLQQINTNTQNKNIAPKRFNYNQGEELNNKASPKRFNYNQDEELNNTTSPKRFNYNQGEELNNKVSPKRFNYNQDEESNNSSSTKNFNYYQRDESNNTTSSKRFNNNQSEESNNTTSPKRFNYNQGEESNNSSRYLKYNQEYSPKYNTLQNNSYSSSPENNNTHTNNYNTSPNNQQPKINTVGQEILEKKNQKKIYTKINNTQITVNNAKKKLNNYFL